MDPASGCLADMAAVVIAYRSAGSIVSCLESLLEVGGVAVAMVVDNSADADTALRCRSVGERGPARVRYVAPGRNLGYSGGVNLGVARLAEAGEEAPWLLIVNPDVELTAALAPLQAMAQRTGAAIVAGRNRPSLASVWAAPDVLGADAAVPSPSFSRSESQLEPVEDRYADTTSSAGPTICTLPRFRSITRCARA